MILNYAETVNTCDCAPLGKIYNFYIMFTDKWFRFYLAMVSPVFFTILNDCVYNAIPDVSVFMPDYTKHEVKRLKKLFTHEDSVSRTSLTEALSVMKAPEKPKITSPIAKKSVGKPVPDFYETIPDISNLDSLDIFDPIYLEDIEIQNEENLSLTIHRYFT